jgi:hypothetical protein
MNCFRRSDIFWVILLVFSFFCISGCGDGLPRRVHVSGRVLIDGKPLEQGTVQVFPKGQRMASGTIGPGGKFTLTTFTENDGCVIGKHPVTVNSFEPIGNTGAKWFAPKKYTDVRTSGLEIDVTGPRDDVEINLTWDGGKPFTEKY